MKRRSVTAGLAAVVLALSVALIPAASASAAANGYITVYNNCNQRGIVFVTSESGAVVASSTLFFAAKVTFSLPPGRYGVTTLPNFSYLTVRSSQGWGVRLCN
jgi:hypothetical protein